VSASRQSPSPSFDFFAASTRQAKKIRVKITNPLAGGADSTDLHHARKFLNKFRAIRVPGPNPVITFVASAAESSRRDAADRALTARITGADYDGVRSSFAEQLAAIPVINAPKLIRKERSSRDWSYQVSVRRPRTFAPKSPVQLSA
jgi:hypothetical protein